MQGIILINKPAGWTSFDVVNYIRKNLSQKDNIPKKKLKVGHAGTLDPFATGLLIILVGSDYTKKASYFSKMDKTYEFELKFGFNSTTGDPEGIIEQEPGRVPTKNELLSALNSFKTDYLQTPPAYSAIKVNGVRAYKLARKNIEVELNPRDVKIYNLELLSYIYPHAKLRAKVSSGTYIRVLSEDIAKRLNAAAYTTVLNRTEIGHYSLKDALDISKVSFSDESFNYIKK